MSAKIRRSVIEIQEILHSHKPELRKQYGVNKIGVFGSYARRENRKESDIDILVELERPMGFFKFLRLERHLSLVLGAKVDLVTKNASSHISAVRFLRKLFMSKKQNNFELRDYLDDIIEMIASIREFTETQTVGEFKKDKKTVFAVIRCLEVIDEASKQIPVQIKKRYQQVPWEDIAGMRNKLIHEYFGADVDIIWHTIQADLRPLERTIKKIIKETAK